MSDTVVVAGASGLIGSHLVKSLRADGARVLTLVRRPARGPDEREWLTGDRPLDPRVLAGARAVVCLNGASIGRLPWTPRYRAVLRESRLGPTAVLATALRALGDDAPAFVCASAVGYYGDRPGVELSEDSTPGDTYLARLCIEWEQTARHAGDRCRVVNLRTAPVLHRAGVLKPLIRLTSVGLGGPIGRGTQIWPWISLEDEIAVIRHVMDADIDGPVNACGPRPAMADDIGRAVAKALHRPFLVPAPAWALTLALGRAATESLLTSDAHVVPAVLERTGFTFAHATAAHATAAALTPRAAGVTRRRSPR